MLFQLAVKGSCIQRRQAVDLTRRSKTNAANSSLRTQSGMHEMHDWGRQVGVMTYAFALKACSLPDLG